MGGSKRHAIFLLLDPSSSYAVNHKSLETDYFGRVEILNSRLCDSIQNVFCCCKKRNTFDSPSKPPTPPVNKTEPDDQGNDEPPPKKPNPEGAEKRLFEDRVSAIWETMKKEAGEQIQQGIAEEVRNWIQRGVIIELEEGFKGKLIISGKESQIAIEPLKVKFCTGKRN